MSNTNDAGKTPGQIVIQPANDTSVISVADRAIGEAVGAFRGTPTLLLVLLLNMIMIGGAGWYLVRQEKYRYQTSMEMLRLLAACREFDPPATPPMSTRPALPNRPH